MRSPSGGRIGIALLNSGDIGERLGVELELRGGDVFLELRKRRGADDRCAEEPSASYIAERELHGRDAAFLRQRRIGRDRLAHHRLSKTAAARGEERETRLSGGGAGP